jgi:hypothetical protein
MSKVDALLMELFLHNVLVVISIEYETWWLFTDA